MSFRMPFVVMVLAGVLAGWTAHADAGPGKRADKADPKAALVRVVYPVADLVIPIDNGDGKKPTATLESGLMNLISATVQPKSWEARGGAGTLQYHPLGMSLVVTQSPEAQAEVANLIAALRRMQDVEVAVEMRIVNISSELAAEFRSMGGFEAEKSGSGKKPVAHLTDKEVYLWLRVFQNDSATGTMQAPKVTMLNGQHAEVVVANKREFITEYRVTCEKDLVAVKPHRETVEVGMRCGFLPTVSADRRTVQVQVDFRDTELDGPVAEKPVVVRAGHKDGTKAEMQATLQQPKLLTVAFKQACNIPDGRTMVVSLGQVTVDVQTEAALPVLSKVPYVCRLVRDCGVTRETREVFLFITPRIIVNEENESH
jgi:general secretion pathway protein D